jgi:hypothetical protein
LNHKLCDLSGNQRFLESGFLHVIIDPLLKRAALFLFLFFQISLIRAQSTSDSLPASDTGSLKTDAKDTNIVAQPVIKKPVKANPDSIIVYHTDSLRFSEKKPADLTGLPCAWRALLERQPYFNFLGKPVHVKSEQFHRISYEGMFYLLILMLFYFAIVKLFFTKYLGNLLTLFFRASMRQQQLREQVLQSPFPSLLLNNLFIFSAGLYGAFLFRYYHFGNPDGFWIHFLYCTILLALLYLLKFFILKLTGWIFNINRTVDNYLFVVFLANKIIGMFLLPFLVILSFAGPLMAEIAITVSSIMICLFYVYRFIAGYSVLHKEIKISGLHFFLYLCALEIAPLLLIYKVLVSYLEKA